METLFNQEVFATIVHQASTFGSASAWLAVFCFGENGALVVFALTSQGIMAPVPTFVWAVFGTLSADLFWYGVAKIKFRYSTKLPAPEKKQPLPINMITNLLNAHPLIAMICIKFLVGLRIFLILYISHRAIFSFRRYLFLNALGGIVFMSVLFPIGWLLGKGIIATNSTFQIITSFLTLTITVVILSRMFPYIIKWFLKK